MAITGLSTIAGQYSQPTDETFQAENPRTKSPLPAVFHNASDEDINRAVHHAVEAFEVTREYPATRIADLLDTVANEIEVLGDILLRTCDAETGLGIARLTGERGRTTNQLRAFGSLLREGSYVEAIIDSAQPHRQPVPRPDIRRMLFPLGPVAVFGASNFPLAFSVAGGDTASAFAAGCPVIVKAHPSHPATSELVANAVNQAIRKSNFPAGFFSLLQGNTIEVGQNLVKHPELEAVGFTGSLRGGRAIFDAAMQRPKPIPVYAEMGSINPVVILPDAITKRAETIADDLVNSITLGTGQFCTNPGLVFLLESPQTQAFVTSVNEKLAARQSGILLNHGIERSLVETVSATRQHDGVTVLVSGEVDKDAGFTFPNTLLQTDAASFVRDAALQVEHFGPVSLFVRCASFDELLHALDQLEGNLTATVQCETSEYNHVQPVLKILRDKVGRIIMNGYPTGVEVVHAMQHGGPYPATTAPASTSVGMTAIKRFLRPIAFQNVPDELLPDALKGSNPLGIWRIVDKELTKDPVQ